MAMTCFSGCNDSALILCQEIFKTKERPATFFQFLVVYT